MSPCSLHPALLAWALIWAAWVLRPCMPWVEHGLIVMPGARHWQSPRLLASTSAHSPGSAHIGGLDSLARSQHHIHCVAWNLLGMPVLGKMELLGGWKDGQQHSTH